MPETKLTENNKINLMYHLNIEIRVPLSINTLNIFSSKSVCWRTISLKLDFYNLQFCKRTAVYFCHTLFFCIGLCDVSDHKKKRRGITAQIRKAVK